jgi:hypothetical protein
MKTETFAAILRKALEDQEQPKVAADNTLTMLEIFLGKERLYDLEDTIVLKFALEWYKDSMKALKTNELLEDSMGDAAAAVRLMKYMMPHHDWVAIQQELKCEQD